MDVGAVHWGVEELMAIYGGACGSTWIGGGRGFMKGLVIGGI